MVVCFGIVVLLIARELASGTRAMQNLSFEKYIATFRKQYHRLIVEQQGKTEQLRKERQHGVAAEHEDLALVSNKRLLEGGECREREFAYFITCVTDEEAVLEQCYASICSLLATTDPPCVVVFVSRWVYNIAKSVFNRNGVLVTIAPEWAPLPREHPYAHLTGSTGNSTWSRVYSFAKFEAHRLTQYRKIAHFDIDIIFMRNASGLALVLPFAASSVPKGKNISQYINNGMMVLQPSTETYNELVYLWRTGDYELYYSDEESIEQDVVTELCWRRGRCGPISDIDACIYNHGAWLPNKFWRSCAAEAPIARHNFKGSREPVLLQSLARTMSVGTCRSRVSSALPLKACFSIEVPSDTEIQLSHRNCCYGFSPEGDTHGGDVRCWYQGANFERCCLGMDDALHIQQDVSIHGESWYGLSTFPDKPPQDWFSDMCTRHYMRHRFTFSSMSPRTWRAHWEPGSNLLFEVARRGIKCKGVDAQLVVFDFQMWEYFERHEHNRIVVTLQNQWNQEAESHNTFAVCVPEVCCARLPENVQTPLRGLHAVLFHYIFSLWWGLPKRLTNRLPAPHESDFGDIYVMNAEDAHAEMELCTRYREGHDLDV